jgi:hypothetical protein
MHRKIKTKEKEWDGLTKWSPIMCFLYLQRIQSVQNTYIQGTLQAPTQKEEPDGPHIKLAHPIMHKFGLW